MNDQTVWRNCIRTYNYVSLYGCYSQMNMYYDTTEGWRPEKTHWHDAPAFIVVLRYFKRFILFWAPNFDKVQLAWSLKLSGRVLQTFLTCKDYMASWLCLPLIDGFLILSSWTGIYNALPFLQSAELLILLWKIKNKERRETRSTRLNKDSPALYRRERKRGYALRQTSQVVMLRKN